MSKLIYTIPPDQHNAHALAQIFSAHREIKFVSLMGVDLGGNATDEKIPVARVLEDIDGFLAHGVQTDGSSVILHNIATLNNARVDLVPDPNVNWYMDYNLEHRDKDGFPVGTLKIPAYLVHNGRRVDSRSLLANALATFTTSLRQLLKSHPWALAAAGITQAPEDLTEVVVTAATELEFWVQTPKEIADVEKLATSQTLKEQYWKRTRGAVRTALEECLLILEEYGLKPEMGHKEVGGVTAEVSGNGHYDHVMEQLEVDWRYSTALQAADNDILVREIISDVFHRHGLDITFAAKPFQGVAGNGKHTHIGVALGFSDGTGHNLFAPADLKGEFLSPAGYGALMGLLKNYEAVSPFVTASIDALARLKPGFEAPVCTVASLGLAPDKPTRNRSVLVGLVRDTANPLATRFELRSPNPLSNTWLVLASSLMAMLDGIQAVIEGGKTAAELEREISKSPGQASFYLETDRAYRSEEDVFTAYDQHQRNQLFGIPPATVWENVNNLVQHPDKVKVLVRDNVFTPEIIASYRRALVERWVTELHNRMLPTNIQAVRQCKKLHSGTGPEEQKWQQIQALRNQLGRDNGGQPGLFSRIRQAIAAGNFAQVSELEQQMAALMEQLRTLYLEYSKNIID